jgi:hypothetical protein
VKFHLAGLKKILMPRPKDADLSEPSGPAQALFGPPPERPADGKSRDLVDFLKRVEAKGKKGKIEVLEIIYFWA